ncbi:MAG: hypothetical protein WBA42_22775 [Mesorhizobium sp.]
MKSVARNKNGNGQQQRRNGGEDRSHIRLICRLRKSMMLSPFSFLFRQRGGINHATASTDSCDMHLPGQIVDEAERLLGRMPGNRACYASFSAILAFWRAI